MNNQAMRNGQNKRMRGRNNNNRKGQNPLTRVYESNGPDLKIRGTASHVAEKYSQLARDAHTSGDPVAAENYYQHAEHYLRLIAAAQEQFRQANPYYRPENEPRDDNSDGGDDDETDTTPGAEQPPFGTGEQPIIPREAQPFPPRDTQHYQPPRDPQRYSGHQPQPVVNAPAVPPGDVGGLPAFITGGGQPQPQPQPQGEPYQGHRQQNGYDPQGDRFPLHRRRRRHRGPRNDLPGAPQGMSNDGPDEPAPPQQPPPRPIGE